VTVGPVWEANHVWLIFSITLLFSAFPTAFSALGTALLAPSTVALLAIVVRSAALGLRASAGTGTRSDVLLSRLQSSLRASWPWGWLAPASHDAPSPSASEAFSPVRSPCSSASRPPWWRRPPRPTFGRG
jgi:cytochrome d ubiquinol oxidase subunit II